MRKVKKFLALALAATMTLSSMSVTSFAATGVKPADGTTKEQPFPSGTGGSDQFRIPCLVTLDDGTIVAACDARWTTYADGGGLDTIVSRSTDGGETWNYTFANYLGDNGNTWNASSTAFIDPALTTDGETLYMIADLYPAGIALNGGTYSPQTGHRGYDKNGNLALAAATEYVKANSSSSARASAAYNYHIEKIEGALDTDAAYYQIKDTNGNVVEGYTIDAFFNIKGNNVDTNLFFGDSPYFPYPTDFLYMTKSVDGGATWSIPMLLDLKDANEQTLLVGPGRGIVTSTGRVVFTAYEYTSGDKFSCTLYSDDQGATWHRGSDVSGWSSESAVTEADGKLYLFTRHGNCYYISNDMGETWGNPISVSPSYNSNCMISAITYSEKVDGKSAILLAAPANTGSRANGKIFLGLVQEDGTLEWVNECTVNESHYAYSCLSELENGNIGLLYENNSSAIVFEEIDIKEVLGLVKNLNLSLGSVYTEEKATDKALEIVQSPDETIAKATSEFVVEEATTVLHNHVANAAGNVAASFSTTADDTMDVADAEFTFTASGDYWTIYNEAKDLYLTNENVASEFFKSEAADMMIKPSTEVENTFTICRSTGTRYVIFYTNNMDFNSNSGFTANWTGGSYNLMLLEKQDTVSENDIVPSYKQVSEITDGKNYLISYIVDENNVIVLYPTNGTANQTKLVGETKAVAKNIVTIEAVGIGDTQAIIGDVTYNISVPDPKDDPSYDADDYDVNKITYKTGSAQPASGSEGPVSYAFDGDTNTFWHSEWNPTWPAANFEDYLWVEMALEEATVVDAVRFLTRGGNGDVTGYRVIAKTAESGDEWVTLTEGTWTRGASEWKLAQFEPTEVTAVRIVATATYADSGNNKFASAREIRLRTAELANVDYRELLNEKIAEYGQFVFDDYTYETAKPLQEALLSAYFIAQDATATPEVLKEAVENLDALYNALVPKCEHTETEVKNAEEATCTEAGFTGVTICKDCKLILEEGNEIAPLGHAYGEFVVVKEATAEEEGLKEATCANCGDVKKEVIEKLPSVKPVNPFEDVIEGQYYYDPVLWAVEKGVTSGLNATTFGVGNDCTREQIVTFLWNYAGKPAAEQTECTFKDVNPDHYYYNAMLWANEKGYVSGYNKDTFGVGDACTREQIVMILWKFAGEPSAAQTTCTFEDADASHYYYNAMLWAVENGVVAGYNDAKFGVGDACTREQIVTFLYRYDNLEK